MPDPQDPDDSVRRFVAVQGKVAAGAARDDQFAPFPVDSAADERMIRENVDRLPDSLQCLPPGVRSRLQKMFDDALEVAQRLGRIDYFRHRTGLGLRARLPDALASR